MIAFKTLIMKVRSSYVDVPSVGPRALFSFLGLSPAEGSRNGFSCAVALKPVALSRALNGPSTHAGAAPSGPGLGKCRFPEFRGLSRADEFI